MKFSGESRRVGVAALAVSIVLLLAPSVASADIFWANGIGGGVGRANNDGSNVRAKWVGTGAPGTSCGIDVAGGYVYWANKYNGAGRNSISRASLDGSSVRPAFIRISDEPRPPQPCGVAVNDSHIYWGNNFQNSIGRANLDASNPNQQFITQQTQGGVPFMPCSLALDDTSLYWNGGRAALDGSGPVGMSGGGACSVTLDGGYLYWVRSDDHQTVSTITRSNLDGSNPTEIVVSAGAQCGIDVFGDYVYWIAQFDYKSEIRRARLDTGWKIEKVLEVSQRHACGLEITAGTGAANDVRAGKPRLSDNGNARLPVHTPAPGPVKLTGRGIETVRATAGKSGRVMVPVRAKGIKAKRLRRNGEVKITAKVVFHPKSGPLETDVARITLRRR